MKRFSKIVSVIIAAPSATDISAISCACMSVGKPGIRLGHHIRAVQAVEALHRQPIGFLADLDARLAQHLDHGAEMVEPGAASASPRRR